VTPPDRPSRPDGSREELCEKPLFIKRVQNDAVALSRELSDYERVKRVYLLPREFSIDKGEMTPTLKIKRSVIDEKYWILRQGGLFDGE
jgi:long-chain acyl-CoA synthetase